MNIDVYGHLDDWIRSKVFLLITGKRVDWRYQLLISTSVKLVNIAVVFCSNQVKMASSATPLDNVNGTWEINSPDTLPPFSAVCYLTALWMMRMHWGKSPLGLIQSDVGGTPIEAWTSDEAMKLCPTPPGSDRRFHGEKRQVHEEEMDFLNFNKMEEVSVHIILVGECTQLNGQCSDWGRSLAN